MSAHAPTTGKPGVADAATPVRTQPALLELQRSLESHFLSKLEYLNAIGIALSQERDIDKLLETILIAAKNLTHADGGTLYRLVDGKLQFEIVRTDSLSIAMGGTSGNPVPFYPIPLHNKDGEPNTTMIAAYAALTHKTVNVADAYTEEGFDFSGTRNFDKRATSSACCSCSTQRTRPAAVSPRSARRTSAWPSRSPRKRPSRSQTGCSSSSSRCFSNR
jgi:hypothetical protein